MKQPKQNYKEIDMSERKKKHSVFFDLIGAIVAFGGGSNSSKRSFREVTGRSEAERGPKRDLPKGKGAPPQRRKLTRKKRKELNAKARKP